MKLYKKILILILFALIIAMPVKAVVGDIDNWFWDSSKNLLRLVKDFTQPLQILIRADDDTATSTDAFVEIVSSSSPSLNVNLGVHASGTSQFGDIIFYNEIKPDGDTCADGEILKKTGANNWDCAAAGGGGSAAWEELFTNAITPTSTTNGIFVKASSTIDADFRVNGNSTTTGEMVVDGGQNVGDFFDFYNGTFLEHFDAIVKSDGTTASTTLEFSGGGDLKMRFSDGVFPLDCAPTKCVIELTAGSDTSPQGNWIYIPQSSKVLTKSTTAWPSGEHIKVGFFHCPSVATIQSEDGCYINQNWNDGASEIDGQGHFADVGVRIRTDGANYFSGIDGVGDASTYLVITAGNVEYKSSSGEISQMHMHTFPAFDTSSGDEVLVKNWNGDAFHNTSNLNDIIADSAGVSTDNKWFNLIIWGVANKSEDGFEPIMINLPACSYTNQASAEQDISGCDDFTIPREFDLDSGTGFLIARLTIRDQATWTLGSTVDLRGSSPQSASGGASGVATNFIDNTWTIENVTDTTKMGAFDLSVVDTANTRTITWPNSDGTMCLIDFAQTWSATQSFASITADNVTTTDSLFVGGYASSTGGLFTQGDLHIGGNATFDGSLTAIGTNITGIPAANILAGTFGTGSYTFDTNLDIGGYASSTTALNTQGDLHVGGNSIVEGTATTTGIHVFGAGGAGDSQIDFIDNGVVAFTLGNDDDVNLFKIAQDTFGTNDLFTLDNAGNATTTRNIGVGGYASTTGGLFTQGDLHVGGNSTFDGSLTAVGTNITVIPAANILAGTFGTGSYTFDTNLTIGGFASSTTALNTQGSLHVGGVSTFDGNLTSLGFGQFNNVSTTDSLFVGGKVGIGTQAADVNLHVFSTDNIQQKLETSKVDGFSSFSLINDAQEWVVQLRSDDQFYIRDGNNTANRLTIDTSGNVGIGDESPASLLTVGDGDLFQVDSSGNLDTTGYASSTGGLFTQGALHVGGNTTFDGTFTLLGVATTTAQYNFVDSIKIPFGTAPTVDDNGEIAIDSTTGTLVYFDGAKRVLDFQQNYSATIASTTFDIFKDIPLKAHKKAITITDIECRVINGTSVVIFLSDGTNDTETITCATTSTEDDGSIQNGTFTARELQHLEISTITGAPDFLNLNITYTIDAD